MTAPITQSTPDVEVTGPTMSSSCDNLLLDLPGSLGNGGRLWSSLAVAIVGADGYVVSNLTEFINGIGVQYISPPIPIPSKLFQQKSGTYAFKFTLCNFFGGCGTASIEVIIVNVVYIESLKLVAVISGGSLKGVKNGGHSIEIDASPSYDENEPVGYPNSQLSYKWSCVQTAPELKQDCIKVLKIPSSDKLSELRRTIIPISLTLTQQMLSQP